MLSVTLDDVLALKSRNADLPSCLTCPFWRRVGAPSAAAQRAQAETLGQLGGEPN